MLPIGSIVFLKEGTRKLMILNRGPVIKNDNEEMIFDYSACFYPLGLEPDNIFYFNEENIDEVIFKGFSDSEEERFQKLFHNWKKDNKGNFKSGEVKTSLK